MWMRNNKNSLGHAKCCRTKTHVENVLGENPRGETNPGDAVGDKKEGESEFLERLAAVLKQQNKTKPKHPFSPKKEKFFSQQPRIKVSGTIILMREETPRSMKGHAQALILSEEQHSHRFKEKEGKLRKRRWNGIKQKVGVSKYINNCNKVKGKSSPVKS